ncbi:Ger(x)C family spore germination protein [Bacillus cereus]|uniref:Ger(x)C family spore germination protein n=1 Tax=Bacillus cereus TaxID=1396 RepID=UPI000BEDEA91|nr:Ger(x)C family spore germination protein [Bacillus cereus]PEF60754.1 spore gernimation protein [Bacillus cereus]
MKWRYNILLLIIIWSIILQGCSNGRQILEDLTLPLILGIDMDEENNLLIFLSSPTLSRDSKKMINNYEVKAKTIREARSEFDKKTNGRTTGGKIQVVLIGKKVLQYSNWVRLLDTMYRDTNYSINATVVAVAGNISDLIYFPTEEKINFALQLKQKIDKANERNITVKTTLQELHSQIYERGITPAITEVKKDSGILITGTALLKKNGKYISSLDIERNKILHILQHKNMQDTSLTVSVPKIYSDIGFFSANKISFSIQELSRNVQVNYSKNKFHFTINLNMPIYLRELLFAFEVNKREKELEKIIEKQLQKQLDSLVIYFQKKEIDPIGLGMYARVYQYDEWKKIQNHWGRAFKKSNIKISVKVDIQDDGIIWGNQKR